MKKKLWGIAILTFVICLLLSSLGIDLTIAGVGIVDIVIACITVLICCGLIADGNVSAFPLPLAVGFLIVEDSVAVLVGRAGEDLISNGLVIVCAVLLCIAVSFLEPSSEGKYRRAGGPAFTVKFGEDSRYIDCADFGHFWYRVKCSDGNIFFENVELYKGGGTLNVMCKLSEVTVNVPSGWKIRCDVENKLGECSVPQQICSDGPEIHIVGQVKLGSLNIVYV